MPADGKGAKGGDVMTKTHAAGSAMSYGQRYLLKLIFNVAIGENDDDGNSAGSGFDISGWRDKIEGASDKAELDVIANELRGSSSIPSQAMRSIRRLWSAKATELAECSPTLRRNRSARGSSAPGGSPRPAPTSQWRTSATAGRRRPAPNC